MTEINMIKLNNILQMLESDDIEHIYLVNWKPCINVYNQYPIERDHIYFCTPDSFILFCHLNKIIMMTIDVSKLMVLNMLIECHEDLANNCYENTLLFPLYTCKSTWPHQLFYHSFILFHHLVSSFAY